MFGQGKQRITKSEVFEKFPRLSLGARLLFDALPKYGDDEGRVDLNMEEFSTIVVFGEPEELYDWLRELIKMKLILPYDDNEEYGYIKGWNLSGSPTYTTTPKDMKSGWRNPEPPADVQRIIDQEIAETEHRRRRGKKSGVRSEADGGRLPNGVRREERRQNVATVDSRLGAGDNGRRSVSSGNSGSTNIREHGDPMAREGRPPRGGSERGEGKPSHQHARVRTTGGSSSATAGGASPKRLKKFKKVVRTIEPEKPRSYSVKELDVLSISEVMELKNKGKITDELFEAYRQNRVRRARKAAEASNAPDPRPSTQQPEKTSERLNGSRIRPRIGTGAEYINSFREIRKSLEREPAKKVLKKPAIATEEFDPANFAGKSLPELVRLHASGVLTKDQVQEVKTYQRFN